MMRFFACLGCFCVYGRLWKSLVFCTFCPSRWTRQNSQNPAGNSKPFVQLPQTFLRRYWMSILGLNSLQVSGQPLQGFGCSPRKKYRNFAGCGKKSHCLLCPSVQSQLMTLLSLPAGLQLRPIQLNKYALYNDDLWYNGHFSHPHDRDSFRVRRKN